MPAVVTVFGLISRYIGGSENYARELSLQLAPHGWDHIVCFLEPPPDQVLEYLNLPNTKVEVLANSDAPRPSLSTLRELSRLLKKHQAKILHLHLVGFVGPYPWWAKLHGVKRIFFTNHMSQPEGAVATRSPLWKRSLVRVINWPMSVVVCVSQYNRDYTTTLDLIPADRFARVYNGVDFSRVSDHPTDRAKQFRIRYKIPLERILVAQVSWIIREKGVDDHLEAARIVLGEDQNCHFVFAGEGATRESFMKKAESIGIGDHVTWTGLVQDPFALGLYDAADIVCQPSRWEEAFGQVIAEAMACGKPVIGTRVGGIPEVIQDGRTGFLIERGDVDALAHSILRLAGDPTLRDQLGRAGQRYARENFDLRSIVREIVDQYAVATF